MQLSAAEQYLLELINRGRLDPVAEADRYGIDLNEGLVAGTIGDGPLQVLAHNEILSESSEAHSAWMLANNVFSHTGESGSSAGGRMSDAGYTWNAPSEVVHQLGYDYPVLGGLNDGWKTRKAGRYRAEASAG
jgi:hypothetical protein